MIFGHFIYFGHFPIEIPIEAKKIYGQQKEESYIKNKSCFENQRPNGTTWNHVEIKIPNFVKIRITLPKQTFTQVTLTLKNSNLDIWFKGVPAKVLIMSLEELGLAGPAIQVIHT